MDPLELLTRLNAPFLARCSVPKDLASVTDYGEEDGIRGTGATRSGVESIWKAAEALYRTGTTPALQLCIRRRGRVVLDRAIGHASGNAPQDPEDAPKIAVTTDTPFCLFSASKAVGAMVVHKLNEMGALHLDDKVCDYIPEFARHGKRWITIRHVLAHRAGIPNIPPEALDLDLLEDPDAICELICEAERQGRPGQLLAYHAVSGGFVLGEVVRRATGSDVRKILQKEIAEPLGLETLRYGVTKKLQPKVAVNAMTGPPVPPPISTLLKRALGASLTDVVDLSNDPRFMSGIIPAANAYATAREMADFYQCLLNEGELDGVRIFSERTVGHATSEQSYREIDLTLFVPLRYGLGLMLGDDPVGLFGPRTPQAFGHLGFTNIFNWADPEREIAVALHTSGKPVLSTHAIRLFQLLWTIDAVFPRSRP